MKEEMENNMLLKTFKGFVGTLGAPTNTYLVYDEKTFEGALIDLANNLDKIKEFQENLKIKLKYLILTHCHADHMAGLKELKKVYPDIKILIHELDAQSLVNNEINLCSMLETEMNFIEADRTLKDGDIINLGEMELKVIHTPGHTAGSISILVEDALFSGDTLFKGTHGRTDMPSGNFIEILASLKKLMQLSDNIIVYPGHDQSTKIGDER